MASHLTISELEQLVAEHAKLFGGQISRDRVRVYEDPDSEDGHSLIVQIEARRSPDRSDWTKLRLRVSQAIRDSLVRRGDDRYPVLEVFGPEEWAARNG